MKADGAHAQAGQVVKIRDQGLHPAAGAGQVGDQFCQHRVVSGAHGQDSDVGQHSLKGVAQVVGGHGQELVLDAVDLAKFLDQALLALDAARALDGCRDVAGDQLHQLQVGVQVGVRAVAPEVQHPQALVAEQQGGRDQRAHAPREAFRRIVEARLSIQVVDLQAATLQGHPAAQCPLQGKLLQGRAPFLLDRVQGVDDQERRILGGEQQQRRLVDWQGGHGMARDFLQDRGQFKGPRGLPGHPKEDIELIAGSRGRSSGRASGPALDQESGQVPFGNGSDQPSRFDDAEHLDSGRRHPAQGLHLGQVGRDAHRVREEVGDGKPGHLLEIRRGSVGQGPVQQVRAANQPQDASAQGHRQDVHPVAAHALQHLPEGLRGAGGQGVRGHPAAQGHENGS